MSEDDLIARLRARLGHADARVTLGIGDDAAVLARLERGAVLSVDAQVEEVHFRRDWLTLADVAHRGVSAALSDLAAMGARAVAVLISWELPGGAADDALIDGLEQATRDYDVPIVGGNVSRGPVLSQHTTVIGEAPEGGAIRRDGAKPGDTLYVTGPIGAAATGLRELMADDPAGFADFWRRPRARLDRIALVREANACVDISDGLASELTHLCRASGVGARVELSRVPVRDGQRERGQALGHEPDDLVAAGGEDYELLLTGRGLDESRCTAIGEITEAGITLVRSDGAPWTGAVGFRH